MCKLVKWVRNCVVFWKNLHSWQKFYTTAGRDGRDKFQVWKDLNDDDDNDWMMMMTMIGMMMTTKIWTMKTTKIMTLTPTMVTAAGVFSGVVLTPRRCHMAAQHFIQRAECGGGGLYRFIKTTPTLNLWQTSTYYVIYHVLYNCNNGLFDVNCVS